MKFNCDSCSAQYMISDDKVGPNGVKVRCKKCGHIVLVRRAPSEVPEPPPAPAPAPPPEGGLDAEIGQAFDAMQKPVRSEPAKAEPPAKTEPETPAEPPPSPEPGPPAAAGADWYVAIDDKQTGPLDVAAVKARWEAGDIGPDSLVWKPGMGDWKPLSGVAELAEILSPIPRPPRKERAPAPEIPIAPRAAVPASPPGEPEWKPAAASALAALASDEIAHLTAPEPKKAPVAVGRGEGRSLVDTLPESAGVDPTGALPLPIKGIETTGEKEIRRKSLASTTAELRLKRSATRTILISASVLAVLLALGVGGVFWYVSRRMESGPIVAQPSPRVEPASPAQPAQPPARPPPPAAAPPAAAQPSPRPAAVPAAPGPAEQAPGREPPSARAAAPRKGRIPAEERPARPPRRGQRLAATEGAAPQPEEVQPEKGRRTGDPLLDFGGGDDLEKELSGGSRKRSVYVPPAPGASDLPAEVSPAQVQEGVASKMEGLRSCLAKQQSASPDSHGTLKIRWAIGPDGNVSGVRNLSPEFADQPIASCLVGVVKSIRFPRSRTTGQEVVFPFKF